MWGLVFGVKFKNFNIFVVVFGVVFIYFFCFIGCNFELVEGFGVFLGFYFVEVDFCFFVNFFDYCGFVCVNVIVMISVCGNNYCYGFIYYGY